MADDKSAPKAPEEKAYLVVLDKDGKVQKVEIQLQTMREAMDTESNDGLSRNPDKNKLFTEAGSSKGSQGFFSKMDEDLFKYLTEFSLGMISKQRAQNGQKNKIPLSLTPIDFIYLHVEKDRNVFEYEVHFVPEINSRSDRFKLVDQALGYLNTTRVYEGDACLYLPSQYITDKQEFAGVIPNTNENEQVKTVITYKRKWKMQECIRLCNVLFKYIKRILQADCNIAPRSQIFPGDVFAVRDLQDGFIVICMDTWYPLSQKKTTLYEVLQKYEAAYPENFKEVAMRDLTGTIVWSELDGNNTFYTIEGFAWDKTPQDTFLDDGNVSTTFIDYYKRQFIDIQHVGQPLLTSKVTTTVDGVKRENLICLVPELSYISRLPRPWNLPNDAIVMENDGLFVPIKLNTVYDLLQEHQAAASDFKDTAAKNIIGEVVLTKYNNKTRKIEDINWYTTPRDAFIENGNVLTPYIDYYKRQYNIDIQDIGQPLLISKFTTKVDGVKQEKLLYLVPELSEVCSLSSRMGHYHYEQEVAIRRGKMGLALYIFLNKMRSSEKAQKVLAGWGLTLADAARMVPPQEELPSEEEQYQEEIDYDYQDS